MGFVLTLCGVTAVLGFGAGSGKAAQAAAFKAAFIYVGPHNDGGWSQAHDQGRLYVQKMLGSKIQTTYKENVPENTQVTQVIEQLVRDGNKIIFATSFGYQNAMAAEAKKPRVIADMPERSPARGATSQMPMTAVMTPMAGTTSGKTRPMLPNAALPRMSAATSVTA